MEYDRQPFLDWYVCDSSVTWRAGVVVYNKYVLKSIDFLTGGKYQCEYIMSFFFAVAQRRVDSILAESIGSRSHFGRRISTAALNTHRSIWCSDDGVI